MNENSLPWENYSLLETKQKIIIFHIKLPSNRNHRSANEFIKTEQTASISNVYLEYADATKQNIYYTIRYTVIGEC